MSPRLSHAVVMSSTHRHDTLRVHIQALERLMQICAEIQKGRYPTKARLAETLQLSPRTIQRDLEALRSRFDAPLEFDRERNGFYFADPLWRMPKITLTEGELINFFTAERILRRLGATSAEVQAARAAVRNLAALLPQEVAVDLAALEDAVSVAQEPALDASPVTLRKLTEAAARRETLHIVYHAASSDELTERDINVLLMHNWIGEWYAISWDVGKQAYRDFHAGRIVSLARTRRHFEPPPDWNREQYLRRGFGMFRGGKDVKVEVEFDAYQARYARERTYHPTQKNTLLKGGGLRITFEATEASLEQVARWLMQFGEHAVALGPPELREMMRKRLEKTLKHYNSITDEAKK